MTWGTQFSGKATINLCDDRIQQANFPTNWFVQSYVSLENITITPISFHVGWVKRVKPLCFHLDDIPRRTVRAGLPSGWRSVMHSEFRCLTRNGCVSRPKTGAVSSSRRGHAPWLFVWTTKRVKKLRKVKSYANRMQMVCWFWTPLAMLSESLVYVLWFSMWPSRSKLTGFGAYCGSSSGFMNPGLTLSSCILRMASEADSRCYVRISGVTAAVLPFMGFDQHERFPATENVDWNRNHKTTSLLDMQSMDPSLAVRRRQNASSYVLKITGDTKRCVWKSLGFFSCGKWSTKQWVFHIYILLQAGQVAYIYWWRQLGSHGWPFCIHLQISATKWGGLGLQYRLPASIFLYNQEGLCPPFCNHFVVDSFQSMHFHFVVVYVELVEASNIKFH